jgi:hypothetical protein
MFKCLAIRLGAFPLLAALAGCIASPSQPSVPTTAQPHVVNAVGPPGTKIILVGTGWKGPGGLAIDAKEDAYVVDTLSVIKRVSPPFTGRTHGKIRTILKDSYSPLGIAVDGHENVYFSWDADVDFVEQITPKGVKNLVYRGYGQGFGSVAVDGNEDVYATANYNNHGSYYGSIYFIAHTRSGGWKAPVSVGPKFPSGVGPIAVDAERNIYVGDPFDHDVKKLTPSGKIVKVGSNLEAAGIATPLGCKVRCPVYVTDGNRLEKISPPFDGPTHGKITEIGYGFSGPEGVAVRSGDVFVSDTGNLQVKEVIP